LITDRGRIFQLFKYVVYALLTANIYFFFTVEWAAAPHRFSDGVALKDIIEGFTATIDTVSWVILLLMFELETYVLEDKHFTRKVTWSMHALRTLCYVFIVYSFYGYVTKLLFLTGAVPLPGVADLCTLVNGDWAYAVGFDEYALLTADNCKTVSPAVTFMQFPGVTAIVDPAGLTDLVRLAWVDVINAGVWLLIVLLLEFDVRLQEHNRFEGGVLAFSTVSKYILYSTLFLAAVYWGIKGDFVDFWDAFLWLVAFIFIEMNVFDWRQESLEEQQAGVQAVL